MSLGDAGCLYVVATPIGNLGDMTSRAVEVLGQVRTMACEDTRRCRALLRHFGLPVCELVALHAHNESRAGPLILSRLGAGHDVALVSDAGTPLVSDPGFALIRDALNAGVRVVPVPGASALTAALSVSPVPVNRFHFEGFLPAKPRARSERLRRLLGLAEPVVFFEAPHRILATLDDLARLGAAERTLFLARELTKMHETLRCGTVAELRAAIEHGDEARGEFVGVLAAGEVATATAVSADAVVDVLAEELAPAQAARLAAKLTGADRRALYRRALRAGSA